MRTQDRLVGAALWAAFGGTAAILVGVAFLAMLLLIGWERFFHGIGYAGLMAIYLAAVVAAIWSWCGTRPLPRFDNPYAKPDSLWRTTDEPETGSSARRAIGALRSRWCLSRFHLGDRA